MLPILVADAKKIMIVFLKYVIVTMAFMRKTFALIFTFNLYEYRSRLSQVGLLKGKYL